MPCWKNPVNDADIIVAAGDIGIYNQGIDWLKSLNKPVIYVAGNHEFYGHEYHDTLEMIRAQCIGSQVRFLDNNRFIFQGVRFFGSTMWADLYVDGDEKAAALGETLNDFKKINLSDRCFDTQDFSQLHQVSKQWLEKELPSRFQVKQLSLLIMRPHYGAGMISPNALKKLAYCNDLKSLLHEYDIAAWFHGHVHSTVDYRISGARILCKPQRLCWQENRAEF